MRVPFSGLLCLPPYLSLSSAEMASTFVVVKTHVVEGARSSAFLLTPLLHLSHSGTLPVGGKHQGTQLRLQSRDNGLAGWDEPHPGERRMRMAKEGGASRLPLRLSSVAEGEHGQDNEDHQQHGHPGSHEPVDQAFLDAPVASLSAVPVSVCGQAAAVGGGQRGKSQSCPGLVGTQGELHV